MGTLTWYGTAQQTQAAHDRLTSIAQATRAQELQDDSIPGEARRTIGQICADAMADLMLDGVTPTGTGGGIRGSVMVTVPAGRFSPRPGPPFSTRAGPAVSSEAGPAVPFAAGQDEHMRSIELTFDPATEAAFRTEWTALEEAGLPNLGRHPGASNRPHLTLAVGPGLEPTPLLRAVFDSSVSAPLSLPVELRVSGVVLFRAGAGRFVLARPVVMTLALIELHRRVLERAPGAVELTQPDRWTPHVTLARRLSADQVSEALTVLGTPPAAGSCVAARFWNGETKTLTALAG